MARITLTPLTDDDQAVTQNIPECMIACATRARTLQYTPRRLQWSFTTSFLY